MHETQNENLKQYDIQAIKLLNKQINFDFSPLRFVPLSSQCIDFNFRIMNASLTMIHSNVQYTIQCNMVICSVIQVEMREI